MSPTVSYKAIKPAKMKEKDLRLTLLNELDKVARQITNDFKSTVSTWEHETKFNTAKSLAGGKPSVTVTTDDPIYRYVDEGTKRHPIMPVNAKRLRFKGTYQAKTSPGVIGSGSGGASGDVVWSLGVMHPGTKARKFTKTIKKKWQPQFKKRMDDAMERAAKKSGHAIG